MSISPWLLEARNLTTGYGEKVIVSSATVAVRPQEVVAVIGHNGAGKSTLLKAIYGLMPCISGNVLWLGETVGVPSPTHWRRLGVSYCPQGNRVFPHLNVQENLSVVAGWLLDSTVTRREVERILEAFPDLGGRCKQLAGSLSGGQKQGLALAMALIPAPRLVLLDEPSLGLDAGNLASSFSRLSELRSRLGVGFIIVEQKVRQVLAISDRVYVLRRGEVSFTGSAMELADDKESLRRVYL